MINVAKKNPYVFTIGFDETDPAHVRAAGILNGTKKKAQLIAAAILSYVDGAEVGKSIDFRTELLQPILERMIHKEVDRLMQRQEFSEKKQEKGEETIVNLSPEEEESPMDENLTQNIVDAMDAFRRS